MCGYHARVAMHAALFALGVLAALQAGAQGRLFEAHSAGQSGGKMDISVREVERRPRSSVLGIEVRKVGSSVGSSFFILCSVRALAHERGAYRYIVRAEDLPLRGQMLVGFLESADEAPEEADSAFAGHAPPRVMVVKLEQFAPICGGMRPQAR
jgi:hypothetical protein